MLQWHPPRMVDQRQRASCRGGDCFDIHFRSHDILNVRLRTPWLACLVARLGLHKTRSHWRLPFYIDSHTIAQTPSPAVPPSSPSPASWPKSWSFSSGSRLQRWCWDRGEDAKISTSRSRGPRKSSRRCFAGMTRGKTGRDMTISRSSIGIRPLWSVWLKRRSPFET